MEYVYILQSKKDKKLYVGLTKRNRIRIDPKLQSAKSLLNLEKEEWNCIPFFRN